VLHGRSSECKALDRLLEAVRSGESRALVLRGESGIGKSALLDYLVTQASGCCVARAGGVQSEMELAFAGLQQLCAAMLGRLECLPAPQRDALETAFGLRHGDPPDRFLIGLAVLSLFSEVAAEQPLVCVVDDLQWLDRASAQTLEFVARRLFAESVGLVFAVRQAGDEPPLAVLPQLVIDGLNDDDARALLSSVLLWPFDEDVRDRFVAETRGNPLALLELPRALTPAELAGGFGLPATGLSDRIEASFRRRLEPLPAGTRRLLLLAAAEPVGDSALLWRAAERLGIQAEAADAAESEGLVNFGARVTFRHPLVRSATYGAASPQERRTVHRALAEATDSELDPDRRAWHLAQATAGPDAEVASELERSAGRAQARGGLAAAAAFLGRSATLTLEPRLRAQRELAAARTNAQAGAFDPALRLLSLAEAGPLDELETARADHLRAQIAFASNRGGHAPTLLLKAARRLEPLDAGLARKTYLEALSTGAYAGRSMADRGLRATAEAARAAPPAPQPPSAADLLLDGMALLITEGYVVAAPTLKRALSALWGEGNYGEEGLRWLWFACSTAVRLWDDESWDRLTKRQVQVARDAGALSGLPMALNVRAVLHVSEGKFAAASSLIDEAAIVSEATGSDLPPYGPLTLAAFRGGDIVRPGEGVGPTFLQWATAVLYNGRGRYDEAFRAAQLADQDPYELVFPTWASVELIEAATRTGAREHAAAAFERLSEWASASGTDWALGTEACARALVSDGEAAERQYLSALDYLGRTRIRVTLARTHLLYGEWLRRERRRADAREQLRTAHEMFDTMGADGFAERAERELRATGATARKRTDATRGDLTAQEVQVARLARDGLSNAEIGARLFISPHTARYHLTKVFTKLDISSRTHLARVLPSDRTTT
jgi:DNA-binding CsgD family transcriptional regulator